MGYCWARKMNEILIHATAQMNLKNVTLSGEKKKDIKGHIECASLI